MTSTKSLGEDLRALRTARKLTLGELAAQMGKSVGWLSQTERDLSTPKLKDLQKLARIFNVPLSLFFGHPQAPEAEKGRIVRARARRVIGERESGVVETLISPDLTDDFEMIHSTFLPGAKRVHLISRATQELAYLVSGKLDIWYGTEAYTVGAGDSFRIRGEAYRWANPYGEPATAIWVISPPVY